MSGVDDHRFPMFTGDVCGGEREGPQPRAASHAAHTVIDHFPIEPEVMTKRTSWLLDTDKRKINVHFLTTICRQTVFVKNSF